MTKKWSSRLTFFAFVVLMVGLGSNDSLRGIFSTIFQEHFSLTTTQLGLIVTASYIGNLVFLLVGGNLSTRFSKKRVLQVLILIWMAALALFAFTSNYTVLLIGMALALGSSTLLNTTMNLITPLLFATAPGFFVNFLFFTQEIGTSGSQYILGSHADGFAFWQHTNLVLLILGAVAFRYNVLFTPSAVLLVWLLSVGKGVISRLLSAKPFLWLAELSPYGFLIHQVLIRYMERIADKLNLTVQPVVWAMTVLLLTLCLSSFYKALERRVRQRHTKTAT